MLSRGIRLRLPPGPLRSGTSSAAMITRAPDASCVMGLEVQGVRSQPKLGLPMLPVLSSSSSYGTQIR